MTRKSRSNWSRDTRRIQFTPAQKRYIINRAHGVCYVCGSFGADEADHIVPIAEGGANHVDNGGAIHSTPCHEEKSRAESRRGYERRQARMHLPPEPRPFEAFTPRRPHGAHAQEED